MSKTDSQRPRLGRGLSSLINVSELPVETAVPQRAAPTPVPASPAAPVAASAPSTSSTPASTPEIKPVSSATPQADVLSNVLELPVDAIVPNPYQPRRSWDESKLKELAASIKSTGLIQPILVRRTADGQTQLIAGERRWRASQLAGLKTIPVIIRDVDVYNQAQMALIENIQREDLNPIDRAAGYKALIEQLGLTQAELAGRLGEDRAGIAHHLRLLELPPAVQAMVRDGKLPFTHAKIIANVPDANEQSRLANLAVTQGLNVRNLERLVTGSPKAASKTKVAAGNSIHLMDLEKKIAGQLGLRVNVRTTPKSAGRGRVVIHYGSLDQFDELMTRLGIRIED